MGKLIGAAATAVAALCATPLMVAVMVTAVTAPAASEQPPVIACTGAIPAGGGWRVPFEQPYVLTSGFGLRFHPVDLVYKLHTGVDLVSQPGPGSVVAAAAGTVVSAGDLGAYGNAVVLRHTNGVRTMYAHLASLATDLSPGTIVTVGHRLGVEGTTGTSTGEHLHFEVQVGGEPVDPVLFMTERGAPLDGRAVAPSSLQGFSGSLVGVEAGIGFPLPAPARPRSASLTNPAQPIPPRVRRLYLAAADTYQLPWTLLAGIGMEETNHGRNTSTSTAGARGLMQFLPSTFASMGVDGNGDGRAIIDSDADSVFSAANYLTASGVTKGPAGVREALFAYNHADWYVNDVLFYARAYGGGTVFGDPTDCGPGSGSGNLALAPLAHHRVEAMLLWAHAQSGDTYTFGANGPHAWDCSSLVQQAFARIGMSMPRTAGAQRDWLASGNGHRVHPAQARPGDLIFTDSYLGPNAIGHVAIVWDPATRRTVEAASPGRGVGHFTYHPDGHALFEIWRVGNVTDRPTRNP